MARRLLPLAAAAALVIAGAILALWPLHADGVRGSAALPRYRGFDVSVESYQPLPQHVTISDLRRLGVRVPQDAVEQRRRLAGSLAAGGLVLALTATLWAERKRYSTEDIAVDNE